MILWWTEFTAILAHVRPTGCGLDTPGRIPKWLKQSSCVWGAQRTASLPFMCISSFRGPQRKSALQEVLPREAHLSPEHPFSLCPLRGCIAWGEETLVKGSPLDSALVLGGPLLNALSLRASKQLLAYNRHLITVLTKVFMQILSHP